MMLRKIKEKIKKAVQKKKEKTSKRPAVSRTKAQEPEKKITKEILGAQELAVEKSKFSSSVAVKVPRIMPQELPRGYGRDRIVLQVRDPWWLHAYWEVVSQTYDRLRSELGDILYRAKRVLRIYDVSHIVFNGKNAHRYFDIDVGPDATNWYIDTGGPGRSWCVDLGFLLPDGRFIMIARSNVVYTPLAGPSWITDEEWMVPDEMFARLYGMGFGFGKSSPVGKAWQERMRRALFSGVLSSPGLASAASPVKKIPKQRKFWLLVNTELIVYGATEPDAKVYVQGREIRLRPDGTFSLRYALPDGKQVIPVRGIAADGLEERTITPIVTKETK
ncbi:MAG: DUF4912 domain-containing protein [Deltaproteobacteria bacterium]